MNALIVDIYEDQPFPVVTHVFNGQSPEEVRGVLVAHMETDAFLRAALTVGAWNGTPLRVASRWA